MSWRWSVNGLTNEFIYRGETRYSDQASREIAYARETDDMAAWFAVMPPVKRWRAEPQVAVNGDFEHATFVAQGYARGWFETDNVVGDLGRLVELRAMSAAMAEDSGIWFRAETTGEAYLQQELRKLCAAIEGTAR